MNLGKRRKKGIAKVRKLSTVFFDGYGPEKPAFLERPDEEKILPIALKINGKN